MKGKKSVSRGRSGPDEMRAAHGEGDDPAVGEERDGTRQAARHDPVHGFPERRRLSGASWSRHTSMKKEDRRVEYG